MAWADAGQRLEAMPTAGTGRDFAVSNRSAVSTPATAACRCRYQSLTAGSMIYDHVSINSLSNYPLATGTGPVAKRHTTRYATHNQSTIDYGNTECTGAHGRCTSYRLL